MVNVRIRVTGRAQDGVFEHATGKVFIRASESGGYPPLLPGEVVALDDSEATRLLDHVWELEMTTAAPTREPPPSLNVPINSGESSVLAAPSIGEST